MAIYDSAAIYIESATTIEAKIIAIEAIQAALLSTALKAASQGNISEYQLNDGQTIIKTVYRNAKEIQASYDAFEVIKQRLINSLNGRVMRLMDSKNFR
jgi:hypothetical protein